MENRFLDSIQRDIDAGFEGISADSVQLLVNIARMSLHVWSSVHTDTYGCRGFSGLVISDEAAARDWQSALYKIVSK